MAKYKFEPSDLLLGMLTIVVGSLFGFESDSSSHAVTLLFTGLILTLFVLLKGNSKTLTNKSVGCGCALIVLVVFAYADSLMYESVKGAAYTAALYGSLALLLLIALLILFAIFNVAVREIGVVPRKKEWYPKFIFIGTD